MHLAARHSFSWVAQSNRSFSFRAAQSSAPFLPLFRPRAWQTDRGRGHEGTEITAFLFATDANEAAISRRGTKNSEGEGNVALHLQIRRAAGGKNHAKECIGITQSILQH